MFMNQSSRFMAGCLLFTTALSFLFNMSATADHTPIALVNSGKVIEEAVKLHEDKKYSEAIAKYLTINRNDTNYSWSLYELSMSYLSNGDTLKSISTIKKGLELHSEYQ